MTDPAPGYWALTIAMPQEHPAAYAWGCKRCACLIAPGASDAALHDQAAHPAPFDLAADWAEQDGQQ